MHETGATREIGDLLLSRVQRENSSLGEIVLVTEADCARRVGFWWKRDSSSFPVEHKSTGNKLGLSLPDST